MTQELTCSTLGSGFDPLAENPYDFYARARREAPVVYSPELNAWLVTRYRDIQHVLLRPSVFSSRDALTSRVTYSVRALEELTSGFLPVPIVLNSDGADHARFRMPLANAFAPPRMRAFEPFIRQAARALVDAFVHDRRAEMVSQYAYPLALEVILTLLGVPRHDIQRARQWSHDWLMLMSVQMDEDRQVDCARSTVAFQRYLAGLVEERRTVPTDDLIGALSSAEEAFTDNELVITLQGLILAGHESTTNMIGTGLLQLLQDPRKWEQLCADPGLIPSTVEEILRYDAPIQMFARTALEDADVDGVTIPRGSVVLLLYGSGNRDEAIFSRPDVFEVGRAPNHHLAFGHGVHFCVGAALARTEGRVAFEVLCERVPGMRLVDGQAVTHIPTLLFRGYESLQVEW